MRTLVILSEGGTEERDVPDSSDPRARTCGYCGIRYRPQGWPFANYVPFCSERCEHKAEKRDASRVPALNGTPAQERGDAS